MGPPAASYVPTVRSPIGEHSIYRQLARLPQYRQQPPPPVVGRHWNTLRPVTAPLHHAPLAERHPSIRREELGLENQDRHLSPAHVTGLLRARSPVVVKPCGRGRDHPIGVVQAHGRATRPTRAWRCREESQRERPGSRTRTRCERSLRAPPVRRGSATSRTIDGSV
jgi:hypothetical protein